MKIKRSFTIILLFLSFVSIGQNNVFDVNFEFQAYPTGLIPGIRLERGFAAKNAVHLRLGYQLIDHRDLGKQDDETGSGYGFTLGYKRFFKENFKGLHLGFRNDFWWNEIDWKNLPGQPGETSGTTKITVVQPTIEAGWTRLWGEHITFTPSVALGFEINVKTEGEPTGEGMILLLGFQAGYRF